MEFIINYVKPYSKKVYLGMGMKFLGTILELFIPYILAHIIDDITPMGNMRLVITWGLIMFLCAFFAMAANIWANRIAAMVARDATRTIRHDLFEKILYLSNRQVDKVTIPSLISRMTSDTYIIHRMIGMIQRLGIRAPIMILGGLVVTSTLDPALAGILAAVIPFLGIVVFTISRKGLPLFRQLQESLDEMVRVVRENASGIRVIKALSKTDYESDRFESVNRNVVKSENKANMTMALNSPVMNILLNAGLVVVIIIGAYRVNVGLTAVGKIMAFLTYFTMILQAVMGVNRIITFSSKAIASANRISEVMSAESEIKLMEVAHTHSNYHLEFKNVFFSYEKVEDNLSDVSFALEKGQTLGIIGPTGAGKSTIAALLMRLYDIDKGSILIDGKDIRRMEVKDLRSHFGVVFQNDAVFKNTIEGNIKLNRKIDDEVMITAAKSAQAYDYIMEAGGFGHAIEARGTNLSGGQKQRLLISRALADNPDILILDDSSSALDYKTDMELRKAIHENYSTSTTIIIAQRVSSVRNCDKILVIDEGKTVGYGTHDELIKDNELYMEINALQIGEVEKYA